MTASSTPDVTPPVETPPRVLDLIDDIRDDLADVVNQAEALSDDLDTLARFVDYRGELIDVQNGRAAA